MAPHTSESTNVGEARGNKWNGVSQKMTDLPFNLFYMQCILHMLQLFQRYYILDIHVHVHVTLEVHVYRQLIL